MQDLAEQPQDQEIFLCGGSWTVQEIPANHRRQISDIPEAGPNQRTPTTVIVWTLVTYTRLGVYL